jgi:hypothetical protein
LAILRSAGREDDLGCITGARRSDPALLGGEGGRLWREADGRTWVNPVLHPSVARAILFEGKPATGREAAVLWVESEAPPMAGGRLSKLGLLLGGGPGEVRR